MNKLILLTIILTVFVSCENAPESAAETNNKEIKENHHSAIDSLLALKTELEIEVQILKQEFEFKQLDFDGKSYYHKNWFGSYYIADQSLMAGVDSIGTFFLIANVWTLAYEHTELDPIQIQIDTALYSASADSSFYLMEPETVACACGFHQAYFTDKKAQDIGRLIAQNFDQEIIWNGIKTLSKRDVIGIKETFEIAEKILQIKYLEIQLELYI